MLVSQVPFWVEKNRVLSLSWTKTILACPWEIRVEAADGRASLCRIQVDLGPVRTSPVSMGGGGLEVEGSNDEEWERDDDS
jgi:hypothetical protein